MKGLAVAALSAPLLLTVPVALLAAGQPEVPPSTAVADIPPKMLELYQAAAPACSGLPWPVLAAVGKVETDHGRNLAVSPAGAVGPMQFLPATFAAYAVDGDRDGDTDINDPADAVFTAAKYLCANGAGQPPRLAVALYNYNHAPAYVARVLAWALVYGAPTLTPATTAEQTQALLANPRLTLGALPRADLEAGVIDGRVIALLTLLLERHTLAVSVLRSGHSECVGGGDRTTRPGCTISLHTYGMAVDIYSVDGELVTPSSRTARALVDELAALGPPLAPAEVGSPFDLTQPGFFTNADHQDHVHVGYRAISVDHSSYARLSGPGPTPEAADYSIRLTAARSAPTVDRAR